MVGDPSKMLEGQMALTSEELRTNARVHELERRLARARELMREMDSRYKALEGERNLLLQRNTAMWMLLRRVRENGWSFFFPRALKANIDEECGRAD